MEEDDAIKPRKAAGFRTRISKFHESAGSLAKLNGSLGGASVTRQQRAERRYTSGIILRFADARSGQEDSLDGLKVVRYLGVRVTRGVPGKAELVRKGGGTVRLVGTEIFQ